MARIKRGPTTRARHKRILKATKGFRHGRKNLVKVARQAAVKAGQNAYVGRKQRKRNMRSLWIIRLNAACRQHDLKYSELVARLKAKKIDINRKVLAELCVKEPAEFTRLVEKIK